MAVIIGRSRLLAAEKITEDKLVIRETERANPGAASIQDPGTNLNDLEAKPSQTKGHVAIFFWEGYLTVAPSLINAIRLFANEGYHVDVITRPARYGDYAAMSKIPRGVRILTDGAGAESRSLTAFMSLKDESGRVRMRNYIPEPVRSWL